MKKLLLVDGYSLFFRSFYATAQYDGDGNWTVLKTTNGTPTNAVRVFCNLIIRILQEKNPDYLMVAFDSPKKSWRHDYDFYKSTRKKQPDELIKQIPLIKEFLKVFGIPQKELGGLEADDIIGILAKQNCVDNDVEIITGDYDFLQLVEDNIKITITKKGLSKTLTYDVLKIAEEYEGLIPNQLKDIKGLMGDVSDNIPGIKGIGKKTAIKLIKEYSSLENLLDNVENLTGALKNKVVNGKKDAIMSKEIGTIITDQDISVSIEDMKIKKYDEEILKSWLSDLELYSIMNKLGV